ncbi:hypothetical protein WN944_013397 [Citrus x changshan-huyou]|uniref:Uncharacterized protein n=1 Tax=Citrus x changshan-huyou TaxID=2935761 RepID=A0AAP0QHW9_9ROSI
MDASVTGAYNFSNAGVVPNFSIYHEKLFQHDAFNLKKLTYFSHRRLEGKFPKVVCTTWSLISCRFPVTPIIQVGESKGRKS